MPFKSLISIIALAGLSFPALSTACQASNGGGGGVERDGNLCLGQGKGQWTFGLYVSAVDVPDPTGGNNGYEGTYAFYIFDEGCNIRGRYSVPNCGTPFYIQENFLQYTLTVTTVDTGVADPYFSFKYGDGKYSIGNNHCVCHDESSGLTAKAGCRCAFPVNGHFTGKRDSEFNKTETSYVAKTSIVFEA